MRNLPATYLEEENLSPINREMLCPFLLIGHLEITTWEGKASGCGKPGHLGDGGWCVRNQGHCSLGCAGATQAASKRPFHLEELQQGSLMRPPCRAKGAVVQESRRGEKAYVGGAI